MWNIGNEKGSPSGLPFFLNRLPTICEFGAQCPCGSAYLAAFFS